MLPETEIVPQRLKPHYEQSTCGTAEAVPLSKTDFLAPSYELFGIVGAVDRLIVNPLLPNPSLSVQVPGSKGDDSSDTT
jgi:hypothetical protein